jgi:hypothetical protein
MDGWDRSAACAGGRRGRVAAGIMALIVIILRIVTTGRLQLFVIC